VAKFFKPINKEEDMKVQPSCKLCDIEVQPDLHCKSHARRQTKVGPFPLGPFVFAAQPRFSKILIFFFKLFFFNVFGSF
jgi:hypothetical protein